MNFFTFESWTYFCPEMVKNFKSAPWVITSLTNSLIPSVFPWILFKLASCLSLSSRILYAFSIQVLKEPFSALNLPYRVKIQKFSLVHKLVTRCRTVVHSEYKSVLIFSPDKIYESRDCHLVLKFWIKAYQSCPTKSSVLHHHILWWLLLSKIRWKSK